jgi:hypothetical protein
MHNSQEVKIFARKEASGALATEENKLRRNIPETTSGARATCSLVSFKIQKNNLKF